MGSLEVSHLSISTGLCGGSCICVFLWCIMYAYGRFVYGCWKIVLYYVCSSVFEQVREAAMSVQGKVVDSQRKKSKGMYFSSCFSRFMRGYCY